MPIAGRQIAWKHSPDRRPPLAVKRPVEVTAVDPAEVWDDFHGLTYEPIDDVYGFLAKTYGLTLNLPSTCGCHARHAFALTQHPVPVGDREATERWAVDRHNDVRRHQQKPTLTYEAARVAHTFARVQVISLERTPGRLKDFFQALPEDWPFRKPRVFKAVDGRIDQPPVTYKQGRGAWGCIQSWRRVIQQAKDDELTRPILVMEDDCRFTANAVKKMAAFVADLPDDWEVAFLGGAHCQPARKVAPGVVRCKETSRTHAVAIHPRVFQVLLESWQSWPGHVDAALQELAKNSADRKFYAIDPFVAIQAAGWSNISEKQEPMRSWDRRVKVDARAPSSVPVVLLQGSRAEIDARRNAGDVHTGYWRNPQTGYDRGLEEIAAISGDDQRNKLAAWIRTLRIEAAAFPAASVGIWHPDLKTETVVDAIIQATVLKAHVVVK